MDEGVSGWHVIPLNDLEEHECSADCWCGPMLDDDADGLVYVHHSLDGREREVH